MKKIKEISIKTSFVFMNYNPDYYTDLLRISKNWISYKRENFHNGKEVENWSYKTKNDEFESKYIKLCKIVEEYYSNLGPFNIQITDCGYYSIRITYMDDSFETYEYCSDFAFNGMQQIADQILSMIPNGEKYPDFLLHDELLDLDIDKLDNIIQHLENKPNIEWSETKKINNSISMPYPIYPDWVGDIFDLITPDYNYDSTVEYIKVKKIPPENLNFRELRAMITWIDRGEHFCDGHIASCIKDGLLLKVMLRLKELYKKEVE